jgi:Ca2+-binding EF-hand superfamily protein
MPMGDAKKQVLDKISSYVQTTFGGNYRKAFDHYDQLTTQNGMVDKEAVLQLLKDANVDTSLGWISVAGKYADTMIKELDLNGDGQIDWNEFESKFKNGS